ICLMEWDHSTHGRSFYSGGELKLLHDLDSWSTQSNHWAHFNQAWDVGFKLLLLGGRWLPPFAPRPSPQNTGNLLLRLGYPFLTHRHPRSSPHCPRSPLVNSTLQAGSELMKLNVTHMDRLKTS